MSLTSLKIPLERLVLAPDREKMRGNLLAKPLPADKMTEGGIELTERTQKATKRMVCDVLMVSKDAAWVAVGDQVIVGNWDLQGTEGLEIGDNCRILNENAVMAKILPADNKPEKKATKETTNRSWPTCPQCQGVGGGSCPVCHGTKGRGVGKKGGEVND